MGRTMMPERSELKIEAEGQSNVFTLPGSSFQTTCVKSPEASGLRQSEHMIEDKAAPAPLLMPGKDLPRLHFDGVLECLLLTIASIVVATGIRLALGFVAGVTIIYPTYYLAVLLVSLTCGARWGSLAVLLSILAVDFVFVAPAYSLGVPTKEALVNAVFFGVVALSLVWIADTQRTLIQRLHNKRQMLALLMKELQHRSKNHLSVVQAIVTHTLRGDGERAKQIGGRIKCLAEADELLTKSPQQSIYLANLAALELNPYEHAVTMQGPAVLLGPTTAQVIALVLHELCTNATKYGALSKAGGHVSVTWSRPDQNLHLRWIETGGPPVKNPPSSGFGLSFIGSLLRNVHGQITTEFRPEGIVHTVVASLEFLNRASIKRI
jgi:two-component sensor histidine kinase